MVSAGPALLFLLPLVSMVHSADDQCENVRIELSKEKVDFNCCPVEASEEELKIHFKGVVYRCLYDEEGSKSTKSGQPRLQVSINNNNNNNNILNSC